MPTTIKAQREAVFLASRTQDFALRIAMTSVKWRTRSGYLAEPTRSQDTGGALRRPLAITVLAAALLVWMAALVWAPSASASLGVSRSRATLASGLVYVAGSFICHQRPERSFHRAGAQLPVCARCFGLYAGGLFGVLAWAAIAGGSANARPRARRILRSSGWRPALIVLALPTLITLVAAWLGWWDVANVPRALSALPLGGAIGALVAAFVAGDLE